MFLYEPIEPYLVRVPTIVSKAKNLQLYDRDNLYPQRCEQAVKRSGSLRSVCNSVADFINGEGFEDPLIAKLIVNQSGLGGQSLNKLLMKVSRPYQRYETIPLHISYNAKAQICAITFVPFDFIRFGLPEDERNIPQCLWYCTNWEVDPHKEIKTRPTIYPYNFFDPREEVVLQQIEEAGGIECYTGQLLYLTPEDYQYPTASFDPVLDDAQAQSELSKFRLGYTQNGFMATIAMVYPGEFESPEEKQSYKDLIKKKKGARNANSMIGLQDKSGTRKASEIFQKLEPANLDKLFETTDKAAKDMIVENEAWPKILLAMDKEGGLFNQQQMIDAYNAANAKTRNRRMALSEVFAYLLKFWEDPIETDARIKEQQYVYVPTPSVPAVALPDVTPGETDPDDPEATESTSTVEQTVINDNLKNLTGTQSIALERILRKYTKGIYTKQMAAELLKSSVGLTPAQCDIFLPDNASSTEDALAFVIAYRRGH